MELPTPAPLEPELEAVEIPLPISSELSQEQVNQVPDTSMVQEELNTIQLSLDQLPEEPIDQLVILAQDENLLTDVVEQIPASPDLSEQIIQNPKVLLQQFIINATSSVLINPNAGFNQGYALRSPSKNEVTGFDYSFGKMNLIMRPLQQPVVSKNPLAQREEFKSTPATGFDFTADRLKLLAAIDWDKLIASSGKNSGKKSGTEMSFNKSHLAEILRNLGFKLSQGGKTFQKHELQQKLLQFKVQYEEFLAKHPEYAASLQ